MSKYSNRLGTCTVSLGSHKYHKLEPRLIEAQKAGFKIIDLFDFDWAGYLEEHGLDAEKLWEATPENLAVAEKLGKFVKSLGMEITCTQPLRNTEGVLDPVERQQQLDLAAKRFPFMRKFECDLLFMCAAIRKDDGLTSDLDICARDLRELGDMAAEYSANDGGPMLKIGYEGLSWARRNTWKLAWEVVEKANHPNVGLVVDTFNTLAVEYADPYNSAGHGRIHDTEEKAIAAIKDSMAEMVRRVPGDKIFLLQVGDATLMDPKTFLPPEDPSIPRLLPWSRGYRLFPEEQEKGGYMPVDLVVAAVLATGYKGPITLEVFNNSLNVDDSNVPRVHSERGYRGLVRILEKIDDLSYRTDSITPRLIDSIGIGPREQSQVS